VPVAKRGLENGQCAYMMEIKVLLGFTGVQRTYSSGALVRFEGQHHMHQTDCIVCVSWGQRAGAAFVQSGLASQVLHVSSRCCCLANLQSLKNAIKVLMSACVSSEFSSRVDTPLTPAHAWICCRLHP
jgi:hypothetical protein